MALAHQPVLSDRRIPGFSSLPSYVYPSANLKHDPPSAMSTSHAAWQRSSSTFLPSDYSWPSQQASWPSFSTLYSTFEPDVPERPASETNSSELSFNDFADSSQPSAPSAPYSPLLTGLADTGAIMFGRSTAARPRRASPDPVLDPLDDDNVAPDPPVRAARVRSPPKVKEEPAHDGAFVFEAAPAAAPSARQHESQVPLRATQASKEMRKLMGVFRLDPFAVQGAVPQEAAGPLPEEGRIFEFQLRMAGNEMDVEEDEAAPASPDTATAEEEWGARGRTTSPPDEAPSWGYPFTADLASAYPMMAPTSFRGAAREGESEGLRGVFGLGGSNPVLSGRAETVDQRYGSSDQRGFVSPPNFLHGDHASRRRRADPYDGFQTESIRRYGRAGESSRSSTSTATSYSEGFEDRNHYAAPVMDVVAGFSRISSASRRWGGHGSNTYS
ncbi:hypothetical protein BV25DRAFT_1987990 [Artomyces pyxidatus]|uniref:Uncharacterized protein n=1 Tax=Artomyces pyxidatus TaxID=48021 RepID=A0ACB8TEN4_9AGAM|nr:hypothetical protein BV25DRAFT_1987990 [Artomyces pyxidatus]